MFIYSKSNQRRLIVIFVLLTMILALGFVASSIRENNSTSQTGSATDDTNQTPVANTDAIETKIDQVIATMTIEEKVAQLFIVTPEALTGYDRVTIASDVTKTALEQYPVGGLVYFDENIVSEDQITTMLANVQSYAQEIEGMSLFTCIDEEGGMVARIANNPAFDVESFENMNTVKTAAQAANIGATIGAYLSRYGFNLDFAPVGDVITNQDNTVVIERSFGSDPETVSSLALEVFKGLDQAGVLATYKHFPGHGATSIDTHEGYAYTNKNLEELSESELIPFADAVENQVPLIMVSHISLPAVTGDNVPSSLSSKIIGGILQDELGYQGLIITDSLSMGAITNYYTSAQAAIAAIQAGNDLILMPENFEEAYQGVIEAVENGEISIDRIETSLRKIIKTKLNLIQAN